MMITEIDARNSNNRTTIVWAFCASLLVNLFAWMFALWIAGLNFNFVVPQHEREYAVSSTSVTISRRVQPRPRQSSLRPVPQQLRPQPQQKHVATVQRPRATEPTKTLAQQLAEQQQTFEKTAQQLKSQTEALSTATAAPIAPSTFRRNYMDLNGRTPQEGVEAVLYPVPGARSHWFEGGMSCYYVHYYAQYGGGGNEEGNIPWPVCYPANHDLMVPLDGHALPVPSPPLGYVLPPGTPLGPLLERIYSSVIHS